MEFSILCNNLLNILKKVNIISSNNSLQIFKNSLFIINNNELIIITLNTLTKIIIKENLISSNINIKIYIHIKKIFDICKKINKNSILNFKIKNNFIIIKSDKFISSIIINKKNDFKFKINNKNKLIFEICISSISLKEIIKKISYSIGNEDTRKYLNGMLIEIKNNIIKFISTDGYRLSISELKINNIDNNNNYKFIITKQGINELIKYLDDIDENIYIKFSNENIYIKLKKSLFISKLLDEKFPEYDSIVYKDLKYSLELNRLILIDTIYRVSSISNEKFCLIKLNFNKNILYISSFNSNQEKSKEYININFNFTYNVEILLNNIYLLETLLNIKDNFIFFKFTDNKSGIYIEEINTNINSKHIIMPIYSL